MIYVVTTIFVFLVEMLCWGLRTSYLAHRGWVLWISNRMPPDLVLMLLHHFIWQLKHTNTGNFTKARMWVERMIKWWEESRWTDHVNVLLQVIEVGNLGW